MKLEVPVVNLSERKTEQMGTQTGPSPTNPSANKNSALNRCLLVSKFSFVQDKWGKPSPRGKLKLPRDLHHKTFHRDGVSAAVAARSEAPKCE
jgi:hypothetical protein